MTGIRAQSVAVIRTRSLTGIRAQAAARVRTQSGAMVRADSGAGIRIQPLTRVRISLWPIRAHLPDCSKAGASHPRTTDTSLNLSPYPQTPGALPCSHCPRMSVPARSVPSLPWAASGQPSTAQRGCGHRGTLIPARPPCVSLRLPLPPAASSVCSRSLPLPLSALETAISLP